MITQAELKEILHYDPGTGIFTWKTDGRGRGHKIGNVAGTCTEYGYIRIGIYGRYYMAHCLAILYTDGYLSEYTVDHIDRVRDNNRRNNLREASHQCQMRNSGINKNNFSGIKGVTWNKTYNKWQAQVMVNGMCKYLGLFTDFLEACYRSEEHTSELQSR